jgi:hypothetical protein
MMTLTKKNTSRKSDGETPKTPGSATLPPPGGYVQQLHSVYFGKARHIERNCLRWGLWGFSDFMLVSMAFPKTLMLGVNPLLISDDKNCKHKKQQFLQLENALKEV